MSPRGPAALAALLALLPAAGCGYRTARLDAYPAARTVAVLPFANTGFRRDLELELTQAVVAEVRRSTSYAIGSPASADLVLGGEMSAWEQVTTLTAERRPLQTRLAGRIEVLLKDRRTGRVLGRTSVDAWTEYPERAPVAAYEGTARAEWVQRAARRIVEVLEAGF